MPKMRNEQKCVLENLVQLLQYSSRRLRYGLTNVNEASCGYLVYHTVCSLFVFC